MKRPHPAISNEAARQGLLMVSFPVARRPIRCAAYSTTASAKYLSLTMPYPLWEDLQRDLDKSCLTTHAWKEIEKRL